MTADDVRARFEAWLLDRVIDTTRRKNGYYQSDETCLWWKLWQDAESAAHADLSGELRELVEAAEEMVGVYVAKYAMESGTTLGPLEFQFRALEAALAKFTQEKP